MGKQQSERAQQIRARRKTADEAAGQCPVHGNRADRMPRRYGADYRYTCGCPTGQVRA